MKNVAHGQAQCPVGLKNLLIATFPNSVIPSYVSGFGENSLFAYNGIAPFNEEYPPVFNDQGNINTNYGHVTLRVPEGTIPRYLYQGWGNGRFKSITDGTTTFYNYQEERWCTPYIEPITSKAGDEVQLPVVLAADQPVVGFQFDLILPEGVTVTYDEDGYENIFLSTARTTERKHTLTAQHQSDGSWRILCYSSKNNTFEGGDGEVIKGDITSEAAEAISAAVASSVTAVDLTQAKAWPQMPCSRWPIPMRS